MGDFVDIVWVGDYVYEFNIEGVGMYEYVVGIGGVGGYMYVVSVVVDGGMEVWMCNIVVFVMICVY